MIKKTVRDIELKNRQVLMRVDFNVPLQDGNVSDDTRIRGALPTIKYVLEQGASLVLMSHLGRPKGQALTEFSLKPAVDRLAELLEQEVSMAPDCVGVETKAMADALESGQILVLENLRFHAEEEGKKCTQEEQKAFASQLAEMGDVYVDDAFGTAHRAHASMAVVTDFMKECVSGFLLEKEIESLGNTVNSPEHPFVVVLGGAKVSGKIAVITNLMEKADTIIVGGGMVYTFLKAQGVSVGNSLVSEDKLDVAREILAAIEAKGINFLLPVDHVVADAFSADAQTKVVDNHSIEDGWMALDIGPKSADLFASAVADAKTVVWNGPMGCFEMAPFANGTSTVAKAIAQSDCVSIIGGGDSVSAINKSGLAPQITHISTGGGASLEFLEGKDLPGIVALDDK